MLFWKNNDYNRGILQVPREEVYIPGSQEHSTSVETRVVQVPKFDMVILFDNDLTFHEHVNYDEYTAQNIEHRLINQSDYTVMPNYELALDWLGGRFVNQKRYIFIKNHLIDSKRFIGIKIVNEDISREIIYNIKYTTPGYKNPIDVEYTLIKDTSLGEVDSE